MEIEFLGTGTSQGVPVIACDCRVCCSTDQRDARTRTSALIRDNGVTLLIDGGPDLRQQMLRSRTQRLDAVLLTHEHMDHIAGLDELRSFNFRQDQAMRIFANEATQEAVRRVYQYAFADHKYPGVPQFDLVDVPKGEFHVGVIPIRPVEVEHYRMPVLGFRCGPIAYITDAKTIRPEELEKLEGISILVLNALRKEPHISHLNLDEALAIVEQLAPHRAYLTHISHYMGLHKEVEQGLPDGVHLAYDGLIVQV